MGYFYTVNAGCFFVRGLKQNSNWAGFVKQTWQPCPTHKTHTHTQGKSTVLSRVSQNKDAYISVPANTVEIEIFHPE